MYDLPKVNSHSPNHEDSLCNRNAVIRIEKKIVFQNNAAQFAKYENSW
jgi:hypothetical protein